MKEYVTREIKPGKYEYGYKLQKLDIQMMIELGLEVPDKIKEVYGNGFNELELKDYIYFNEPIIYEFIKRQYYIRNYEEFANMNLYELELLLKFYNKRIQGLTNIISKISNKERLFDLEISLKILKNEMQSVMYLRDSLIDMNQNKIRK